jgi:hypothetical protein
MMKIAASFGEASTLLAEALPRKSIRWVDSAS